MRPQSCVRRDYLRLTTAKAKHKNIVMGKERRLASHSCWEKRKNLIRASGARKRKGAIKNKTNFLRNILKKMSYHCFLLGFLSATLNSTFFFSYCWQSSHFNKNWFNMTLFGWICWSRLLYSKIDTTIFIVTRTMLLNGIEGEILWIIRVSSVAIAVIRFPRIGNYSISWKYNARYSMEKIELN